MGKRIFRTRFNVTARSTPPTGRRTIRETCWWSAGRRRCRRASGPGRPRTSPAASGTWTRWPPAAGTSGNTGSWRPRTADSQGRRTGPGTRCSCFPTSSGYRGKCLRAWWPCTRCSPWTWRSSCRWPICRRRRPPAACRPCCCRWRASCAAARARTVRTGPDSIPANKTGGQLFGRRGTLHNAPFSNVDNHRRRGGLWKF